MVLENNIWVKLKNFLDQNYSHHIVLQNNIEIKFKHFLDLNYS